MNNIVEIAGLLLFLIGLYGLAARRNIIKSILSLGIMDIGIILFFLGIRYVPGAVAPIGEISEAAADSGAALAGDSVAAALTAGDSMAAAAGAPVAAVENLAAGNAAVSADAVPQALMITAIVIGAAVTAVGLMMFIALYHRYGTTNWKTAHEIRRKEREL